MTSLRQPTSFIATDKPEATQVFFTDVLGLKLIEASDFALVFDDGEHMLRVQIVSKLIRVNYTVHGWQVTDIATEISAMEAKGVVFLRFEQLPQDQLGVWASPDGHKIAWFSDPSGNTLSLTQYVPT